MRKVPTIASVTDNETQGKRIYTDIFLISEDAVDLSTEPEIGGPWKPSPSNRERPG